MNYLRPGFQADSRPFPGHFLSVNFLFGQVYLSVRLVPMSAHR